MVWQLFFQGEHERRGTGLCMRELVLYMLQLLPGCAAPQTMALNMYLR